MTDASDAGAGRIILITGGTRGIGRAIALRFAREHPAHLVLAYNTNHDAARSTAQELLALGVACTTLATDLGRPSEIDALFASVKERFDRLDVFVSNAARAAFRDAVALSQRSWQRTLDLNASAFLLASQRAAALMPARGGSIVGLSSAGSQRCAPGYLALGAAKAALEATARYLAVELAPRNINVNVVCGGLIESPELFASAELAPYVRRAIERTPAGRLGRPEELAEVVEFLASPRAAWIRGQTIIVDGGHSLVL